MILHDIIEDRVIITNQIADHWWETNIYQLNDDGERGLWLERSDSHAESQARDKHKFYAGKTEAEIHKCKYCDKKAITLFMGVWYCSHHFDIYVRERC